MDVEAYRGRGCYAVVSPAAASYTVCIFNVGTNKKYLRNCFVDDSHNLLIGVQARVEDAGVLADNGRYEGALLMLLIAVAATSRKRYPRGTPSKKHGEFTW